jgi:hypothetical protein
MFYIAISSNVVLKLYFCPSKNAFNRNIYINKCLKKVLLPFIKKYHSDNKYIFWPDKQLAHYVQDTQNFHFVANERNPTNLPQCRPIEDFFGYLSSLVYANGWKAKDVNQLKNRIKYCLKKLI